MSCLIHERYSENFTDITLRQDQLLHLSIRQNPFTTESFISRIPQALNDIENRNHKLAVHTK